MYSSSSKLLCNEEGEIDKYARNRLTTQSVLIQEPHMSAELKMRFHHSMLGIYDATAKLKPPYRPSIFLRMVHEHEGTQNLSTLKSQQVK